MAITNRLKKTFIASAILIFFTFGAFAMSMASDSSADAALHIVKSLQTGKDGVLRGAVPASQMTPHCGSADVPRSAQPHFQTSRVRNFRSLDPLITAAPVRDHGTKVSLQILHSVLNL